MHADEIYFQNLNIIACGAGGRPAVLCFEQPDPMGVPKSARRLEAESSMTSAIRSPRGHQANATLASIGAVSGTSERTFLPEHTAPRLSESRIVAAGGSIDGLIEALLDAVRGGTMEVRERSAAALRSLALQSTDHAKKIARHGIGPLIGLLDTGSTLAQAHSAATLCHLTLKDHDKQMQVANKGGISALVGVLRTGGNSAAEQAAAALASISCAEMNQAAIIKAGAVVPLVGLLRVGQGSAQVHACQAVANLACCPAGQEQIRKANGVPCLLLLLGSGKTQEHAARALGQLAHEHLDIQREVCKAGGIPLLLALLSGINTDVQVQACAAISSLAQGANGKNRRKTQEAIAKAGGIGPLLQLVESRYQDVIAAALHALASTARSHRENQDAVATYGGIKTLTELLQPNRPDGGLNTPAVQANAALAIMHICRGHTANQTAAAEYGCLGQLGVMAKGGTTLAAKISESTMEAEAAGALWALSEGHKANKVSIAASGAIVTLCHLLGSPSERAQRHAASALSTLCEDVVENMQLVAAQLVGLLADRMGEQTRKDRAVKSLWRMSTENPTHSITIAKAGGAEALVDLLQTGADTSQEYALWSLSLSIDESNCAVVCDSGGVKPLVRQLTSSDLRAMEQAASALARLSLHTDDARLAIARAGGIEPLVTMLEGPTPAGEFQIGNDGNDEWRVREGSRLSIPTSNGGWEPPTASQEFAAACLSEMAKIPANRAAIKRAGGIPPLVMLVNWPVNGGDELPLDAAGHSRDPLTSKKHAAAALARLSTEHVPQGSGATRSADNVHRTLSSAALTKSTGELVAEAGAIAPLVKLLGGEKGQEAQEEAASALFAIADHAANRLAITDAGGIAPLVNLLGSTNPKAREHAEGALVRLSIENANRVLIIKQLVSMLGEGANVSAQETAAAALANLARDSKDNRTSIVEAGGILPLLALMNSSSNHARENTLQAITQLCTKSKANQDAVVEVGGVRMLVNVLTSATSNVKDSAAANVASLAAMAVWRVSEGFPTTPWNGWGFSWSWAAW